MPAEQLCANSTDRMTERYFIAGFHYVSALVRGRGQPDKVHRTLQMAGQIHSPRSTFADTATG